MNPLPHDYQSGALVHSATQLLAFQEWKLGFIKMFNDKPLLISVPRSLLSCCTVLDSLNSSNKLLILIVWSFLAPKWSIPVPICGIDHQKSNFSLISSQFLNLLKPLGTIIQLNYWSSYPSELINFLHTSLWDALYDKSGKGNNVDFCFTFCRANLANSMPVFSWRKIIRRW